MNSKIQSAGPFAHTAMGFFAALVTVLAAPVHAQESPSNAEPEELEEVVVSGQRQAELRAVEAKRKSDNVVESLQANDVGKLPDQNVAEAAGRLAGISVATDKGEGRFLIIRGLEPNLANVTLNNQTATAPEPESRQIKLDDIPSSLIGSVSVIKSLTPDLDANAIAGQVDISTLNAFDKDGTFASARLIAGQYQLGDGKPYEGDATWGRLLGPGGKFGIVLSGNYSTRPINSENLLTGDQRWQTVGIRQLPVQLDVRRYDPIQRSRSGGVANFDWRPSDNTEMFFRAMYAQYKDAETRNRFRVSFPTNPASYTNQTDTTGSITGTRGERYVRKRTETDETFTFALGGKFRIGDNRLQVQATHSRSDKNDPIRDEWRFRTGGSTVAATYDLSDEVFLLTPGAAGFVATNYNAGITYNDRTGDAIEDLSQIRLDFEMPLSFGNDSYWKLGAKYLDRDKSDDREGRFFVYNAMGFTLANATGVTIPSTYDGRYAFGPAVDFAAARAFFDANPAAFTPDNAASLSDSLGADYEANETILAAYIMTGLRFSKATLTAGVRAERAEGDYAAKTITPTSTLATPFNSFGGREYTTVFPGVNLKWNLRDNLMLRSAVTTAIGRPDYNRLAPNVIVDTGGNTVTLGNPDLAPLRATNYDLALEYYTSNGGLISLGLFRKDITNPIFVSGRVESGIYGGVPLVNAVITQPRNGEESEVSGFELSVQMPFDFLPSPWNGFGINTNLTLLSGDTRIPGRADELPLFLQSDRIANAQLYFEKRGFLARVAYSYRSKYLDVIGTGTVSDVYTDDHGQVDARVGYDFNEHFSVFVEGQNVGNVHDRRFIGSENFFVEDEVFGRLIRAGVQANY